MDTCASTEVLVFVLILVTVLGLLVAVLVLVTVLTLTLTPGIATVLLVFEMFVETEEGAGAESGSDRGPGVLFAVVVVLLDVVWERGWKASCNALRRTSRRRGIRVSIFCMYV